MSQERLQKMVQLLKTHRVVPRQTFLDRFEISPATFKRDLEYLRDRLGAPIVWDRERRGYRFDLSDTEAETFEMPGLWFNSREMHALLTMHQLIDALQPSLLTPHIEPLKARIEGLLEGEAHTSDEVRKRIRILHMNARPVEPGHFEVISSALLAGKRLNVVHYNRKRDQETGRELSPQRLIFYRDNWYLDAWCHLRKGLRTFSVDAIHSAHIRDQAARDIDDADLDEVLTPGFGIFSGRRVEKAVLRFEAQRARWVSREFWHEEQEGEFELDGSYVLKVPYSDPRELVMDILKFGPDVEVLGPAPLRELVAEKARLAAARYPIGEPT